MTQPNAEQDQLHAMSVLGHELRRPLTVIRGAATLMLESAGALAVETQQRMLEMIDQNVEELSDLIEDVLLMVHLEANDVGLFMEPIAVSEIVSAAVEHERRRTAGHPVTVLDAAPGAVVDADRARAGRCLRALIGNAARYSPAASPIEVSVRPEGAAVRFEVRDRGPGIPATEHERAFARYEQLEGGGGAGLGLGLYLVRGLARVMGGDAGLSERADGGLAVWFTLKRSA